MLRNMGIGDLNNSKIKQLQCSLSKGPEKINAYFQEKLPMMKQLFGTPFGSNARNITMIHFSTVTF